MTARLRSPTLHYRSPLTPLAKAVSPPLNGLLTVKNFLFVLTLSVSTLVWSHQFGFLSALGLPDGPLEGNHLSARPGKPQHDFKSGPVRVVDLLPPQQHVNAEYSGHSDSASADESVHYSEDVSHSVGVQNEGTQGSGDESQPKAASSISEKDETNSASKADEPAHENSAPIDDLSLKSGRENPESDFDVSSDKQTAKDSEASGERHTGSSINMPVTDREEPQSLRVRLNFTTRTAINFMHFHKTGGVSFKTSLHKFYFGKLKGDGSEVSVRDACYARKGASMDSSKPTFLTWRCDWEPVRAFSEAKRNELDFSIGHQFWGNGIGDLLNKRDLRSFTILRHPFDRKVSFYYHFFVRELGRKEEDVSFEEMRDFLLFDKLIVNAELGRDLGPNYMAGRLLSNGFDGFVGNSSFQYYKVDPDQRQEVVERALNLVRDYIFVGLQKESPASKCMLRKVVELFNEVNGVDNSGADQIDKDAAVLNTGSYSLTAKEIWRRFTPEDRGIFDRKERVDLQIYEEGERLFSKQIDMFGCRDRVKNPKYLT